MHKFNNVITMGCRLNSWESNKINNFIIDDKKNDVMIFNSCCVTNDAVKSLKRNIKLFHKNNPDVKIVVTGCAVESERYNLENMEEVIALYNSIPPAMVKNCMLFLMRQNIKPMWEDPNNKQGGCFSFKVGNKNVPDVSEI